MLLSCKVANLKTMFGGEKRLTPKTNKKVPQTANGYSFRNKEELLAKQAAPTNRRKSEENKFLGLSLRFPLSSLEASPVADKKNAKARAKTHKEIILTGALKTTRRTKTSTGYRTPAIASIRR